VARADLGPGPDGRRQQRLFVRATPAAAIEARRTFLRSREDGFTIPKGRQPTVAEWVLYWLHTIAREQVAATSWHHSYRPKIELHVAPHFAHIRLADLSEEDIEVWHRRLKSEGSLSASSITTAHRIFSGAIKVAVVRGRIPRNPLSNVHPPKAPRPAPEPPSADEVGLILAACRGRPGGARWVLAICTGLRQGEALALQWKDIRLTAPASVTVRRSMARVGGETVMKEPKSRRSRRTVPLPAVAVAALTAHRDSLAARPLPMALVFANAEGQPTGPRADRQAWADLLAELGLPHYRVHDLRHAYATTLLEQGMDPRVVQDLMGWSTAAMAEIYQHVRPVMHARAVSALDGVFGGG
jgi:integrase